MDFKYSPEDLCERLSDGRGSKSLQEDYSYYGGLSLSFRIRMEIFLREKLRSRYQFQFSSQNSSQILVKFHVQILNHKSLSK